MPKTFYSEFDDINELQRDIMVFIDSWVHDKKTPVPHKEILREMACRAVHTFTTANALVVLLRKGYIRRAYSGSNKTFYVQLRNVRRG